MRMRMTMRISRWTVLALASSGIVSAACSLGRHPAQVPVTTSSAEARELYLEGRGALDALRHEEAALLFARALMRDPEFALANLGRAQAAPTNAASDNWLNRALALSGGVSQGERLMIFAAHADAKHDRAAQLGHCTELARLYPDDARAQVLLGDVHFEQNDSARAIRSFQQALAIEPTLALAHRRLGETYAALRRYDEAKQELDRFVKAEPSPRAHGLLARILLESGEFEEAIASYERALTLNPADAEAAIGVGSVLLFWGKTDQALSAFRELHDRTEDVAQRRSALVWIGATHAERGATDAALESLRAAIRLAQSDAPERARLLGLVGDLYLDAGSVEEAAAAYEEAERAIAPTKPSAILQFSMRLDRLYRDAKLAVARHELAEARAAALELRTLLGASGVGRKEQFYELSALIALAEGSHRQAALGLQTADQSDPRLHYLAALAYRGFGQSREALSRCQLALACYKPRFEVASLRAKARRLMEELAAEANADSAARRSRRPRP